MHSTNSSFQSTTVSCISVQYFVFLSVQSLVFMHSLLVSLCSLYIFHGIRAWEVRLSIVPREQPDPRRKSTDLPLWFLKECVVSLVNVYFSVILFLCCSYLLKCKKL
jgi:hypothetical protein